MPSVVSSHSGRELDATSDAIDEGLFVISLSFGHGLMTFSVNVIRGKSWNDESEFDENLDKSQFRDYEAACDRVKAFYKEQHGLSTNSLDVFAKILTHKIFLEKQTVAFNIKARVDFKTRKRARMGVWEAIELLNTLIDESDPDVRTWPSPSLLELITSMQTDASQIEHLLQTAEAIRRDGKPEWMQVSVIFSGYGTRTSFFQGNWLTT